MSHDSRGQVAAQTYATTGKRGSKAAGGRTQQQYSTRTITEAKKPPTTAAQASRRTRRGRCRISIQKKAATQQPPSVKALGGASHGGDRQNTYIRAYTHTTKYAKHIPYKHTQPHETKHKQPENRQQQQLSARSHPRTIQHGSSRSDMGMCTPSPARAPRMTKGRKNRVNCRPHKPRNETSPPQQALYHDPDAPPAEATSSRRTNTLIMTCPGTFRRNIRPQTRLPSSSGTNRKNGMKVKPQLPPVVPGDAMHTSSSTVKPPHPNTCTQVAGARKS